MMPMGCSKTCSVRYRTKRNGPDIEDPDFLIGLGIPEDELDDAYGWDGWTAGMVRQGLAELANSVGIAPEKLLAKALKKRRDIQDQNTDEVQKLEATIKVLRRRLKAKEDRLTRERMLPEANTLQKITRYEAHLSRQLLQALHELQRLQAARGGQSVPLPAALDVVVDGASGEDMSEVFETAQGSCGRVKLGSFCRNTIEHCARRSMLATLM